MLSSFAVIVIFLIVVGCVGEELIPTSQLSIVAWLLPIIVLKLFDPPPPRLRRLAHDPEIPTATDLASIFALLMLSIAMFA